MYEFFNIETSEPEIPEPDGYPLQSELLSDVYNGKLSPFALPLSLYKYTRSHLQKQVNDAFGEKSSFRKLSKRKLAAQFEANIGVFSGAKTFQELLHLSKNVFNPNGVKKDFNEFLKIGRKIDDTYNKQWLFVEQNAAFRQAQGAEDWVQIQEEKEIFPYLKYQTVADSRVRDEHVAQDNKTYPVGHPFWDTWYPPNGWHCRCIVVQEETKSQSSALNEGTFEKNEDPVFGGNVGKTGLIFPGKHPYFDVPDRFKKTQKNNFGFGKR